jgi:hypothetical protein
VRFEHIAGKHCNDNRGYNGNFITVEEMLGCTTVQCLVPKYQTVKLSKEDSYFLTGLGDLMPERNDSGPVLTPVINGADRVNADDIIWPVSFLTSVCFVFPKGSFINITSRTVSGAEECPSTPPVSTSMHASHDFILITSTSMGSWNGIV